MMFDVIQDDANIDFHVKMSDMADKKFQDVLTTLVITGLGLYIATVVASAISRTIDYYLPEENDQHPMVSIWLNVVIAVVVVLAILWLLMKYKRSQA